MRVVRVHAPLRLPRLVVMKSETTDHALVARMEVPLPESGDGLAVPSRIPLRFIQAT